MFTINFEQGITPSNGDYFLMFPPERTDLLVLEHCNGSFRFLHEIPDAELLYCGRYNGTPAWACLAPESLPVIQKKLFSYENSRFVPLDENLQEGLYEVKLRETHELLGEQMFWLAARASQLLYWNRRHRYCGLCGTPSEWKEGEMARSCPSCGEVYYPQLSPAIIVAIEHQGKILMVQSHKHRGKFYGLVAGFVEAGESIEQAVHREVLEETGLRIRNLEYWKSQDWPFPNSLMLAFFAEYDGGELIIQKEELRTARWFAPNELPPMPPRLSVSRQLVEHFVERRGSQSGE